MLCLSGFELYSRWVPLFLSFFPQRGAWSQANFIHNPRLHSHKFGNVEFEAPDLWLLTRSLLTHVSPLK